MIQQISTAMTAHHGLGIFLSLQLFMMIGERLIFLCRGDTRWDDAEAASNLAIALANLIFNALVGNTIFGLIYIALFVHVRLFTISAVWWGWIFGFLMYELIYYINHRMTHRMGMFWAFHSVHHSSRDMNTTVGPRGFLLNGSGLTQPTYYAAAIFGMPLLMFAIIRSVSDIYGTLNHTRLMGNLGVLRYILITPSDHRVHHGSQEKYLDKNYGHILKVWDQIFGSYQREEEEPIYGLVEPLAAYSPFRIQLSGIGDLWARLQRAPTLLGRLEYLFRPPGWRHPTSPEYLPTDGAQCLRDAPSKSDEIRYHSVGSENVPISRR
jgi:sterol desaturase/sphingolipid hydroxylase (fatty acid hydroxylase superfamily)